MLDDDLWGGLGLGAATLERRAAFFLQYAKSLTQELDPDLDDLIRRAEVADDREGEALTWIEPLDEEDDADLDAVVAEPPRREPRGFDMAIRADALRESAQAMLTVDVHEALGRLRRSGEAYVEAGVPYGHFLLSIASPSSRAPLDAAWTLMRAWPPRPEPDIPREDRREDEPEDAPPEHRMPVPLDSFAAAARDPAQQLYLALATRQDPYLDREFPELFPGLAEQPQARSSAAVGTTGLPLGDWWSLLSELTALADEGALVRARLQDFAAAHARQLERARATPEWDDGRAAVDIVDLDVAAATCVAVRRMRVAGLTPLSEDDFSDADPLARVSLSVGLDMARDHPDPPEDIVDDKLGRL